MNKELNLGIEISESVINSEIPHKIKRYYNVERKITKGKKTTENRIYRYRPGVNSFILGDLDV